MHTHLGTVRTWWCRGIADIKGSVMSDKPSYLGLLNAIAVGERGGEQLFDAWAAATPDDDVRGVLQTVALREGEHAKAFAKRINELGFNVRPKDDPDLAGRVAIAASSSMGDCEKFERLGFSKDPGNGPDFFVRFFEDTTMDIQTGELMGRYVSEERDTGRRLRACYAQVRACAPTMVSSGTSGVPAELDERLCRLEAAIADLATKTDRALKLYKKK